MVYVHKDPTVEAGVISLLLRERKKLGAGPALDRAMRQFGYGLTRTSHAVIVKTYPHGVEICRLPGKF